MEIHPKRKARVDDCPVWTENELQLLETTADFKVKKAYEGVNLECVKHQKQPSIGIFTKKCSENMYQIYRRTPMRKWMTKWAALAGYSGMHL